MSNKQAQAIPDHLDFRTFYKEAIPTLSSGNVQATGRCPFHDDERASFSVNLDTGLWMCHAGCGSGNAIAFHMKLNGVDYETARKDLVVIAGVSEGGSKREKAGGYDYKDKSGRLLYQVVRYEPKDFRLRRKGANGEWIYNLKGVRRVPYNLPELMNASAAVIVEGEKDADNVKTLGYTGSTAVTTTQGGAKGWKHEYADYFLSKSVAIIPDNDQPGLEYAETVARSLQGKASLIKIVELPDLGKRKEKHGLDVSDWIALRHNEGRTDKEIKGELTKLIKEAPTWEPKAEDSAKTKKSSMAPTALTDLFAEPETPVAWLVDGLLPMSGFSALVAKPKVGKSTLARNLAFSIATGTPFLGKDVHQGPVIYYALEEKREEVKKHFRDMGATGCEPINVYAGGATKDAIEQMQAAIREIRPVFIIVDPLFRLIKVRDGNDYAQMTQALEPILRIARDSGSHVQFAHHSPKGKKAEAGDSVLGSIAIFGSVDTLLLMKRHEHYRTIQSIQRYGEDLPETTLCFDMDCRTVTLGKSKLDEDMEGVKKTIFDYLSSHKAEPIMEAVIESEVEGRTGLKAKALRELVASGTVIRHGKGAKGDPFKYSPFLLPTYIREGEKENPKNELTAQNIKGYSTSHNFQKIDSPSQEVLATGNGEKEAPKAPDKTPWEEPVTVLEVLDE